MPSSRTVVAIKVHFTLNTPDRLRRVIFGLEKDTPGNTIAWKINFQLFEREKKTDDFGDAIVDLDVEVDTALNAKADKAAQDGLTEGQENHILGPAADDARDAKAGDLDEGEAKETIQKTLRKK